MERITFVFILNFSFPSSSSFFIISFHFSFILFLRFLSLFFSIFLYVIHSLCLSSKMSWSFSPCFLFLTFFLLIFRYLFASEIEQHSNIFRKDYLSKHRRMIRVNRSSTDLNKLNYITIAGHLAWIHCLHSLRQGITVQTIRVHPDKLAIFLGSFS